MNRYSDPITQDKARRRSADLRGRKARVRAQVKSGTLPLHRVLMDRPPELAAMTLADVALMAPRFGRRALETLGKQAVAANVNLLVPLDRASVESRAWLGFRLRRATPRPPASRNLPGEPFSAWLRDLRVELGSYAAVARELRITDDMVRTHSRGKRRTIRSDFAEAALARRGLTLADLWPADTVRRAA